MTGMIWEEHLKNRGQFPAQELAKYYGRHVAWNQDGTKIVASGDDDWQVFEAVQAAGLNPEDVVFSYVPLPDEVWLGTAFFDPAENQE
jgi:hypothetical protein